jgi:hypothetical protein
MVKLEQKHLKSKKIFGEFEVNPAKGEIYNKLFKLIANNTNQVNVEDGMSDFKLDNLNQVLRQLLIYLTNIENEEFWSNKTDDEMLEIINSADGDFKEVIQALVDIAIEIANDVRKEDIRKLQLTRNWVVNITKELQLTQDVNKSLKKFGVNMDMLNKLQQGDKTTIEEFQRTLFEKKKREYKKKK